MGLIPRLSCALDWLTLRGNVTLGYAHLENRVYQTAVNPPADGIFFEGRPWLAVPFGNILVGFGSQYRFFFTTQGRVRGQSLLEHQEFRPVFVVLAWDVSRSLRLELDFFSWGVLRSSGPWSDFQVTEHRALQGIRLHLSRLSALLEGLPLELGLFAEVCRYLEVWEGGKYKATLPQPVLGLSGGLEWGFEF
jgi:hypothetical protein